MQAETFASIKAEALAGVEREKNPAPLPREVREKLKSKKFPIVRHALVENVPGDLLELCAAIQGAGLGDTLVAELREGLEGADPNTPCLNQAGQVAHLVALAEQAGFAAA